MRINGTQSCNAFGKLYIKTNEIYGISQSSLKQSEELLSKTKHVDVFIDSQGITIKKKMTEILQKIQSFSLFPQENSVGISVMENSEKNIYKLFYETLEEAKDNWKNLCNMKNLNKLESTTKVALWLDNYFESKKRN